MPVFENYAKYYDMLYKNKDYRAEVDYVSKLFMMYSPSNGKELLNIGCGTGNHDRYFNGRGFSVDAFDMSEEMIREAREQNSSRINFFRSSIQNFESDKKYDFIVSLFHVLSYQVKNSDVESLFNIVKKNLKPGGVFVFDFWYGPAVLNDLPEVRVKKLEAGEFTLTRTATPEMHYNDNVVAVNYDIDVTDAEGNILENIKEIHNMRYFFIPELEDFAEKHSCKIHAYYEWMKIGMPSEKTWNICAVGTVK